jgi:hypothetical protein
VITKEIKKLAVKDEAKVVEDSREHVNLVFIGHVGMNFAFF